MNATDQSQLQSWIRRRDADAFKDLTVRYSGLVYRTCLRITSDPGDAEDLTQECFETLACQARAPRAPLGAWLHRVATNRALNRVKARRRRVTREADYMAHRPNSAEVSWSDIDGMIDEAIADLPEELRSIVIAHFLQGESYTSIAARLRTSRQTATNRIQKGVALIRESLQKRGVPVSVAALAALLTANAAAAEAPVSVTTMLGKLAISGLSKATAAECSSVFSTTVNSLGGVAAMKSSVVTAGAVIVLLAGGAVTTKKFHDQNKELQSVRDENRLLAARAEQADILESELQSARAEVTQLSKRSEQPGAADAAFAVEATNDTGTETPQWSQDGGPKSEPATEKNEDAHKLAFSSLLTVESSVSDSQRKESRILRTAADRYGALYGLLKLPGEVQGKVRAALTAHVRAHVAAGVPFSELKDGIVDTQHLRETLSALLTPEEMAVWEAFESDVPYYHAQQEFVGQMTRFIPALSPGNLALASSVLADEKLLSEDWIDGTDDLSMADKSTERYNALERARVRLGQLLTDPEQYALVDDYIQQQQAIIQTQTHQGDHEIYLLELDNSLMLRSEAS